MPRKSIKISNKNLTITIYELKKTMEQLAVAQLVLANMVKRLLIWSES